MDAKRRRGDKVRALTARLRRQIRTASVTGPAKMPGERKLAQQYGVSRDTVRAALRELERAGLILRRRRGTTWTQPRQVARLPATQGTQTLLWWQPHHQPGTWRNLLDSMLAIARRRARQLGYHLQARTAPSSVEVPRATLSPPHGRYDGIVVGCIIDPAFLDAQFDAGIPVVAVDLWTHDARIDCVAVQCDTEGMRLANLLLRARHRRIGYVMGFKADQVGHLVTDPDSYRVLGGLEAEMRRWPEATHLWLDDAVVETPAVPELAETWAALPPDQRPTAMCFFSLETAEAFLAELPLLGLRCPDDVSVAARSGEPTETHVTHVQADLPQMGALAVELLDQRITGQRCDVLKAAVPSRLVRGSTVAQPP